MNKLYIICIDDQPEVLNALEQDLSQFDKQINVEVCESGAEALELLEDIDQAGDFAAIIISDQVMPEMTGVQLLSSITKDSRFYDTQKILLTGLATHQDTIDAINSGGIQHYIEKPWKKEALITIIKTALTHYVITKGIDYQSIIDILDQETLYQSLRNKT